MGDKAGKLWQRVPDETGKAQLQEVDYSQFKIDGPTIVYLSGFLTNNDKPGYVSGSIKKMEEVMKYAPSDSVQPKIYAWSHKGLSNLFNLAAYDSLPSRRASNAGHILAEQVIMPLVADEFKMMPDGSCLGHKIPAEEAAQRLRNLTFFGYSAGSIVAQETRNAATAMMKKIGYTEKEANKLAKEVVLIAAGCISRPTKELDRYTTIALIASNDRINRFKNLAWGLIGTLRRAFTTGYVTKKNTKALNIRKLSPSYVFVTAAARPTLYEYKVDIKTGAREKKDFDPLYPGWLQRRSYHEMVHYVTVDDKNNGFSRLALYALVNAVNRTGLIEEPLKLLEPPANDPFGAEAQASYRQRLEAALKPTPAQLARR